MLTPERRWRRGARHFLRSPWESNTTTGMELVSSHRNQQQELLRWALVQTAWFLTLLTVRFHLRWEVNQDKLSFKEAPGQASWVSEHFFKVKFFSIRFLKDEGFLRQTFIYQTLNKFNTKYKHNPQPMCMEEAGEHPVSRAGSTPQARTTGQLCTFLCSPSHQMSCFPLWDISVVWFLLFLSRYQQPGPWKTSWGIDHVLFQWCTNSSLLLDSFRKRNRRLGKTSVMSIKECTYSKCIHELRRKHCTVCYVSTLFCSRSQNPIVHWCQAGDGQAFWEEGPSCTKNISMFFDRT